MKKAVNRSIGIILFLLLGISSALLVYLILFAQRAENLSGKWERDLDLTQQAAVAALDWLQDIEGVSVSLEDMEVYMQNLTVQVSLSFEQTARSEGNFRCTVLPESYEACSQAAYEAFAAAFRDLLAERLRMAGYGGDTNEEAVEALVSETFEMSTVSYLMTWGPKLLPSLEELQAGYGGNGTYTAAEGVLTRRYDSGGAMSVREESYILHDSSLILSGETGSEPGGFLTDHYPMLYRLTETPRQ